jgi:hypothetical protein
VKEELLTSRSWRYVEISTSITSAVLGLANKAAAKKFYYTLMMGGQGKRLAADQAQFGTKMTPAEGS